MGKRGYQGDSPRDIATDIMDKFIARTDQRKKKLNPDKLKGRRKSPDVPFHMWPLKDQIAYYDDATPTETFHRKWSSYIKWQEALQKYSGMYPITFIDCLYPNSKRIRELFDKMLSPSSAYRLLQKEGILH